MLIRYVGLDVHKDSIKIAVAEEGREPARFYASNQVRIVSLSTGSENSVQIIV